MRLTTEQPQHRIYMQIGVGLATATSAANIFSVLFECLQ